MLDPAKAVPICTQGSTSCTEVNNIASSSREFCEYLGFNVLSPDERSQLKSEGKNSECFNGMPRYLSEKGKLFRTWEQRQEHPNEEYEAWVHDQYMQYFKNMKNLNFVKILMESGGPLFSIIGVLLLIKIYDIIQQNRAIHARSQPRQVSSGEEQKKKK